MIIHYQGDQIKKEEMGGACSMHGEMRNAYKVLVGKSEERDLLGPRHRKENDIQIVL
jgi:hypothetical protein